MLTSWECAVLWPEKCQVFDSDEIYIDHFISLGTGTSSTSKHKIGPHSPKRDRFLRRLFGNYMRQLDGEEQWKTFIKCIPAEWRPRYHRLNIALSGTEPALDDVASIDVLKEQASRFADSNPRMQLVLDTIIASIFYFELDKFTLVEGGGCQCTGTIFCRLPMDVPARQALYDSLLQREAIFVLGVNSVPCVEVAPKGAPIFRRSVNIYLKNRDDAISILVDGITSKATRISGMPTKLDRLMKVQNMSAPFGCLDDQERSSELPSLPMKRKVHFI